MSLPRYPDYSDSGVEWLGDVPTHWRVAKIKTFAHFCGGGTPSREKLNYWNGDIPWVSPKDMKAERISGAEERITDEGLSACASPVVDAGSLLMVVRSGILKHTIPVAINDVPVALNQDMKALRFTRGSATSEFFLRWVQGLNDLLLLAWAKQGATVESIEHAYLEETLMPLPPIEEQAAIAAFLDRETAKIDALIAEQEKLLALLAEKRRATISQAVTRGLNPGAALRDSGIPWLGKIPKHWAVVPLKRIGRLRGGSGFPHQDQGNPGEELNFFKVAALAKADPSGFLLPGGDTVSRRTAARLGAHVFPAHSIVFAKVGAALLLGRVGLLASESCIDNNMMGLVVSEGHCSDFIRQALSLVKFDLIANPGAVPSLSAEQIGGYLLPCPPREEQEEIAEFLQARSSKFDALQAEVRQAITLLNQRRSALIAAAVTGQIDVRGVAEAQAA